MWLLSPVTDTLYSVIQAQKKGRAKKEGFEDDWVRIR